jgi:hypothetical protein
MDETFHLVCHDCPEEGVYDDRRDAETARETHELESDHRMTMLDIAASSERAPAVNDH